MYPDGLLHTLTDKVFLLLIHNCIWSENVVPVTRRQACIIVVYLNCVYAMLVLCHCNIFIFT